MSAVHHHSPLWKNYNIIYMYTIQMPPSNYLYEPVLQQIWRFAGYGDWRTYTKYNLCTMLILANHAPSLHIRQLA